MPTQTKSELNLDAQTRMGEIVASGDYDRLTEVLVADLIDHDPAPDQGGGAAGIGEFWAAFKKTAPDVELTPQQVFATDDFVTAVLTVSGTDTGGFLGHAPTGKRFEVRGIQVGKFENGKMTERWGSTDQLGILQQLGLQGD